MGLIFLTCFCVSGKDVLAHFAPDMSSDVFANSDYLLGRNTPHLLYLIRVYNSSVRCDKCVVLLCFISEHR